MGLPRWHNGKEPDCLQETQETWVRSLGLEDALEEEMATHSSILAWKTPWTEEPEGLLCPWGCKESDMTEQLTQEDDETRTHSFPPCEDAARKWLSSNQEVGSHQMANLLVL